MTEKMEIWGRVMAWAQRCLSRNSGFMLLFFGLNYFTLAWSLVLAQEYLLLWAYGNALFLAIFLLTGLLDFFLRNYPRVFQGVKYGALLLAFVPFIVEFFVMYSYQALIGAGVVNSILETNLKEAWEFTKMYVGWQEIGLLLLVAGAALAMGKLRLGRGVSLPAPWLERLLRAGLPLGLLWAAVTVFSHGEFMLNEMLPIQRAYAATSTAVENMRAYHRLAEKINTDIKIIENRSQIKNIVFILGEATNRNHMHLYGYYLPNTPHLDELQQKGEICVFKDIISPHSTTVAVLSKLFTFCERESPQPWYEYHNLIDVMNTAGYKTFWLSNQESSGIWGNIAQIYANHSSWHKFTRIRDSHEDTGILDECLFPLLDEAKATQAGEKNFYVLHLMGGHGLYYNRYPYRFHKFTGADIRLDVSASLKDIVAQYDNALYYNDHIVNHIIDTFREEEALVIYVPDHGEAVYDEGGSIAGHIEENPNRHMIEIPMIIWASASFREKYPDKWAACQAAVDRPYMTDDMIHTILDIADIYTEEYQPEKSIVNPAFDHSRRRIFNDLDYDTQIRGGKSRAEAP